MAGGGGGSPPSRTRPRLRSKRPRRPPSHIARIAALQLAAFDAQPSSPKRASGAAAVSSPSRSRPLRQSQSPGRASTTPARLLHEPPPPPPPTVARFPPTPSAAVDTAANALVQIRRDEAAYAAPATRPTAVRPTAPGAATTRVVLASGGAVGTPRVRWERPRVARAAVAPPAAHHTPRPVGSPSPL